MIRQTVLENAAMVMWRIAQKPGRTESEKEQCYQVVKIELFYQIV